MQVLSKTDFVDMRPLLPPLIHTICLVYTHSKYYNTTARIIVLMQELCNLIIDLARKSLDPQTIFHNEVEESLESIKIAIRNFREFKACYQEYKARLSTYFGPEDTFRPWDFREALIFQRLDNFMDRLETLMEFFNTAVQFQKLERIEIGGLRGKALTHHVEKVYKEFSDLYVVFKIKTYDCLDPEDRGFLEDYEKFNTGIASLDRKLGAIFNRAFDDCIVRY